MRIKIADIAVIILLLISILFIKNIFVSSGEPVLVVVTSKVKKELPMKDHIYDLTEDSGFHMLLEVKDGKARIKESDCPNQFCVRTGWISGCGEAAVCMPFKVVVYVKCQDSQDGELDSISR